MESRLKPGIVTSVFVWLELNHVSNLKHWPFSDPDGQGADSIFPDYACVVRSALCFVQYSTGHHRLVATNISQEEPVCAWHPSLLELLNAVPGRSTWRFQIENEPQSQIRCHKSSLNRQARPPAVPGIFPFRGSCSFFFFFTFSPFPMPSPCLMHSQSS